MNAFRPSRKSPSVFSQIVHLSCGLMLIVGATSRADIISYEACGEIVASGGFPNCLLHRADDGTRVRPFNTDGLHVGDRVIVSGTIDTNFASICGGSIVPGLMNTTVELCLAECGTLVDADGCLRFDSDRGPSFVLENNGGFAAGSRVYVNANGTNGTMTCGGDELPFVSGNLISTCFEQTGRVVSQFGCPSLLTADGARYDLLTFGPFADGDFVSVQGALQEEINGGCGYPLVDFNSITEAFGGSGTLVNDPSCGLVFAADIGSAGIAYVLDNYGTFQSGDRVVVTGEIDDGCDGPAGCDTPCLRGNTIGALTTACGIAEFGPADCLFFTPDDGGAPFALEYADFSFAGPAFVAGTLVSDGPVCDDGTNMPVMRFNLMLRCVDVCGEFLPGFECTPLFLADDGQIYWLDNFGPFSTGDIAHIRGGYQPGCNGLCPFTCVRVNSIDPCGLIPGDVNGDGSVDTDDTMLFVNVLLGLDDDAYRVEASDVNIDGIANGRDVSEFVLVVLGVG